MLYLDKIIIIRIIPWIMVNFIFATIKNFNFIIFIRVN